MSSQGRRGGRERPNRQVIEAAAIAALSLAILWIVWLYTTALRDPRYLDGWLLAGGVGLQVLFHVAIKAKGLSPRSLRRWRRFHVFMGFLLIAIFVSHTNFTFPDSALEWTLWSAFVLVALSGVFGTYLAWSGSQRRPSEAGLTYDRIPAEIDNLARSVEALVERAVPEPTAAGLPAPPYDAWISDLYRHHLHHFFEGPRNLRAHLFGSEHHLDLIMSEIDSLSRYVDPASAEKLAGMRALVIEKDRLDNARVHLGLGRGWQLVHVPVTYALIVLTITHVIVAYAFSSGDW